MRRVGQAFDYDGPSACHHVGQLGYRGQVDPWRATVPKSWAADAIMGVSFFREVAPEDFATFDLSFYAMCV